MKKLKIGRILTGLLMIFILSCILPECATTRISSASDESRRSLMMHGDSNRYKGRKTTQAKASRSYKKSKKRSNQYKKSKHKYKKRR